MTVADWLQVVNDGAALGCRQIQFIGGEPTLHPNLRQLINAAVDNGYLFIEVYTNATALTNKLIHVLLSRGVYLATSFYSNDPATHDRVTGRPGSFDQTIRGIRRAVDAKVPIRAGLIETVHNAGHRAGAETLLAELGVTRIGFDRERGIGRGQTGGNPGLMTELCGQCSRGKLCVTADAASYPCVFSRFVPLGDVRQLGLQRILESARLAAFRQDLDGLQRDDEHGVQCEPNCTPNCIPVSSCNPCEPMGGNDCTPRQPCNPFNPCSPKVCTPSPD